MTINVNKKKSSSWSNIFHCSEEWKYKFYIFTSENITFSKYWRILFHYFVYNKYFNLNSYVTPCYKQVGQ